MAQQKKAALQVVPKHEFKDGETFLYMGVSLPLKLVETQATALRMEAGFFLKRSALKQAGQVFTTWYKQQARQVFTGRVKHFATAHGFKAGKIRISSARTRWGSCSSRGTLSFTWRLVMAPQEVIDYVVVHELVHLEIKNHSAAFWAKVQEYVPDFKKKRAWLKSNGYRLELGD